MGIYIRFKHFFGQKMHWGNLNMEENKYYCPECGAEMYEKYENKSLRYLSRKLTNKYGKGFSLANLHFMIAF